MFFIKLLDEEDVKFCREGIQGLHFQDGGLTQPLNKSYNVKKNQQTSLQLVPSLHLKSMTFH